jgi:tRNA(adenine34) deaminase
MSERDKYFMRIAIDAAYNAKKLDEVPIGACIVDQSEKLLATGFNKTIVEHDPTAHAEILVLREAGRKVGNYRLTETTVYTTIEPCVMCAGALVNARVKRIVFGATDKRFGAVKTLFNICDNSSLNHKIEITSGVLADECKALMQDFFQAKRNRLKNKQ